MPVRLYFSHDATRDRLVALDFGAIEDGQPPGHWLRLGRDFRWLAPDGNALGFVVERFSRFDPENRTVKPIWDQPVFDAPLLGLAHSPAGEVIMAARNFFGDESSTNCRLASRATALSGEAALDAWRACLMAGDTSAHYGVGRSLYELDRFQEAYRHLRHFAELAPHGAWHWRWYGKAAQSLGNWKEARHAYEIAIELEQEPGQEVTDARELLDQLREPD
jgi:tetratricopeptide (TPR) repeat protein